MGKKAGIYIRNAKQNNANVVSKKERAINICEENNWDIFKVYIDDGFSGTNIDRPGLQEMLKDAEDNKMDILFVDGVYNLSRTSNDMLYISKTLKDNDIVLMSIEKGKQLVEIDYDDVMLSANLSDLITEEIKKESKVRNDTFGRL